MDEPRVAIVGAGLAGLTCAYRLAQADIDVEVYEASDHVGGRCWSGRGWPDGQVFEHGGELVESWQPSILALVDEFGLELEHRSSPPKPGTLFRRDVRSTFTAVTGFPPVLRKMVEDLASIDGPTATKSADALDAMSAGEWIEANVPDRPDLRELLDGLMWIVGGWPADRTSAISLLALLAPAAERGDDVELADIAQAGIVDVMHVHGGNGRIAETLAEGLGARVHLRSPVRSVSRKNRGFEVTTDGAIEANRVVLAASLPALRAVDLKSAGLPALLEEAIDEMPMGQNTKLILGFSSPPEAHPDWEGHFTFLEEGITTWSTSNAQRGDSGILTLFTADRYFDAEVAHGEPSHDTTRRALDLVDRALPGYAERFNGRAWLDSWPDDPWTGGSYSVFAPGQSTRFAGALGAEDNGLHVAGEHTSIRSQGYMDGAIESGERVAHEVRTALGR